MSKTILLFVFLISILSISITVYAQPWSDVLSFIHDLWENIFGRITGFATVNETNTTNNETTTINQTCPTCTSPSSWTTCANNTQSRTNYKCDSTTNYQCQSYTETQSCTYGNQTQTLKNIGEKCASYKECASGICIYTYCSPQPQPASKPATVTKEGDDGTWCYSSDDSNAQKKDYCIDNTGIYYDFCVVGESRVRDYYCTGTWSGGRWSEVKCVPGGYGCGLYVGSQYVEGACSDGACIYTGSIIPQCTVGAAIESTCFCGNYVYRSGYCCSNGWQSTSCSSTETTPSPNQTNVTQTCPTCSSPTAWSACVNNAQWRTNYQCNATSNQCQGYTESQSCTTLSNVTPPVTAPPTETPPTPSAPPVQTPSGGGGGGGGGVSILTCKAQGAAICSISETCSEKWLTASDTDRCCSKLCVPIVFNKTEVEKKTEELSQTRQQTPQAVEISTVLPALELAKENITNPEHIKKIEQVAVETLEVIKLVVSFENQTETRGIDYSIRWIFGFVAEQEKRDAQFLEARSEELLTSSNNLKSVAEDLEDVNAKNIILGESEKLKMQANELSQGANQKRENARGILSWIGNFFGQIF